MKDLFYDQTGLVIAAVLLALMAISIEAGFRIGARAQSSTSESLISQVKAMQASLLGLLALLLGFTFSIASDLFNTRSNTVVDEANAIRTVYRRTELLPESSRGEVRAALRKYVSSRAQESELASTEHSKRDAMLKESVGLQ